LSKGHDYDLSEREKRNFDLAKQFDDDEKYGPNTEMESGHFERYTQVYMADDKGNDIRVEDHTTHDGGSGPHKHKHKPK